MLWKQIPGYGSYEISEGGSIRKTAKVPDRKWGGRHHWIPGVLIKPGVPKSKDDYLRIRLVDNNGLSKVIKLHVIATRTWHGPKPTPKHCALHIDDNKYDNRRENLYWGTKKQNAIDRSINGKHGIAKLTATDVDWIRFMYRYDAWLYRELAELFNVHTATIAQVIKRKTFVWVL